MASFLLIITNIILYLIFQSHSTKPKENWFTFPITNQDDPSTKQIISNAIKQLSETGVFHLQQVLSPIAIKSIKSQIKQIMKDTGLSKKSYKSRRTSTNIFGDKGDDRYNKRHARNSKRYFSLTGIPRYQLKNSNLIEFYEYEPLRLFLKTIITSTRHELPLCDAWIYDCKQWKDLYGGTSKESSSLYVGILKDGDNGGYHFGRNGITCVFMINSMEIGGEFVYKWIAPKKLDRQNVIEMDEDSLPRGFDFEWDWKVIKEVINDDIGVSRFHPNAGDLHCFKGNVTLNKIDFVEGRGYRIALNMNFWEENIALTKPVQEIHYHEL